MTSGSGGTAFVTDADGFVGREVVRLLLSRRQPVFALTRTREGMARLHEAGARPVLGDLLTPGRWQDETAAADWVFHLPPYTVTGRRMTRAWAAAATRDRVTLDGHLLDTLAAARPRRIVYVADASAYGPTGPRPVTEDEPLRPTAWGRCHTPALDRVDGYLMAGLPIVTALPGWIYGNGGWFRTCVIDPVLAGRRVPRFGSRSPWVSAVHVHDCARALVHLAEHGEPGGRYFVTDGDPIRFTEFAARFAALGGRRLRVLRLPASALGLMVGPVLAEHLRAEAILSNIRLRSTGFRFCHPTLDHGIEQVLETLHA